ncbi:MAG: biopolymer transporter ExbD [Pseudomonadota bacterium]
MSLDLGTAPLRRRLSLTPMIDIVFLLIVFFMLAAGFSPDMRLNVSTGGAGVTGYSGPPRLVDIHADKILLNGIETPRPELADALSRLVEGREDAIVLRANAPARLGDLTRVIDLLTAAGFTGLVLVE